MDILNDFIPQYESASVGKRWVGAAIDYFIYFFIYYALLLLIAGISDAPFEDPTRAFFIALWGILSWVGIWFLLFPVVETLNHGKTLGKAIVGVRVVKSNGGKPNFGHIVVRHLFDFVDYMPFFGLVGVIVAANTEQRQRVGDLIASTIVINDR